MNAPVAGGSFEGLPETLQEIAAVAGLEAAMKLAWGYGGTQVLIPGKVGPNHWLTRCVGRRAAEAICAHYRVTNADDRVVGNFRLHVPQGGTGVLDQARRCLARDLASGTVSVRAAARRAGLSERTAWRVKAQLDGPGDPRQPDLFAD